MSDDGTKPETATAEVVRYAPAPAEEYRPRIMLAPEEAKALDDQLRANMLAVLRPDVDYGVIPGTKKPSLYKPGAEKLLQWFGFGHTMTRGEVEREADGSWQGVTYTCTVIKTLADGHATVVATCDGYAGYDEERFYTSLEASEARERAMAERYNRAVNRTKIAEYRAPRNSVIKMAQKRGMVGAALQATSASSLFTQDMEDIAAAEPVRVLAEAADAVILEAPPQVLDELGRWHKEQGWPLPAQWNAEQWCRTLVAVGRLSTGQKPGAAPPDRPAERLTATPADDPWQTAPNGSVPAGTDQEWLAQALKRAFTWTEWEPDGLKLWQDVSARLRAGQCTKADADQIAAVVKARKEELDGGLPVEGVVVPRLEPEHPWAAKVDDITSQDDADAAEADLKVTFKAGNVDQTGYDRVLAAIRAKAASLPGTAAAA